MLLADWLKNNRKKNNMTQHAVAEKMNVSQTTVSFWESGRTIPNALEMYRFATMIGLQSLDDIPFEKFYWRGERALERMSLYELPTADTVKTFEGRIYTLKGFVGIEQESGTVKPVTELYYRTKTVVKNNRVTAKRTNENAELEKVKPRKIKLQVD